jgi:hypothetical protein
VIEVPTPPPIVCSPSSETLSVGQVVVADCSAAGYSGTFSATLADPSIASATLAAGTTTFYYIQGSAVGSTTLELQYQPGLVPVTASLPITVVL